MTLTKNWPLWVFDKLLFAKLLRTHYNSVTTLIFKVVAFLLREKTMQFRKKSINKFISSRKKVEQFSK